MACFYNKKKKIKKDCHSYEFPVSVGQTGCFFNMQVEIFTKSYLNSFDSIAILHAGGRTVLSETEHFGSGTDNLVPGSR